MTYQLRLFNNGELVSDSTVVIVGNAPSYPMAGQIIEGTPWRVVKVLHHTAEERCLEVEMVEAD